jgi:hypothetical protein
MDWDNEKATEEFNWLRLMSRFKYDEYRDFMAGSRFVESLVRWLQQFSSVERAAAYELVRRRLVFISDPEMQRLIEAFFPQVVYYDILDAVAQSLSVPDFTALSTDAGQRLYRLYLNSTLFLALSDGARIDALRRANFNLINNDQIVQNTQLDQHKWKELRDKLRERVGDGQASFRSIYLVDDFTASGTTFCREKHGVWKGKLWQVYNSIAGADLISNGVLSSDWQLHVHHLVATKTAAETTIQRESEARAALSPNWFSQPVRFTFGTILGQQLSLSESADRDFLALSDKYYNTDLETTHVLESDVPHVKRGYGGVALPLVLVHNTPNNSMPLLWAEVDASDGGEKITPLFRRRQRYG